MGALREASQQDRRVYVGNLAYEVKWHTLKDFMRSGKPPATHPLSVPSKLTSSKAGEVLYADVLLLPNGMSKVTQCHG